MTLEKQDVRSFRNDIYTHFRNNKREFPWRSTHDPYKILVSEVMLQQTQAGARTIEKYKAFIKRFPTVRILAKAPLKDVLLTWQGLGYNRRAKALKETAEIVVRERKGVLPTSEEALQALPGIGPYTAGAIMAFAFNKPVPFIETNVRTVFLHFFFKKRRKSVSDKEIMPLIEATLDVKNPRGWYSALMDYGAMLKKQGVNHNTRSKHYTKQSPFQGSDRQIRGVILKVLVSGDGRINEQSLLRTIPGTKKRIKQQIENLKKEGFLKKQQQTLVLS